MRGYCFDPRTFIDMVKGYKELSPQARWAFRELLDALWISDQCQVPEDDVAMAAQMGLRRGVWIKLKQELFNLDNRVLMLNQGFWSSPWLERQFKLRDMENNSSRVAQPDRMEVESQSGRQQSSPSVIKPLGSAKAIEDEDLDDRVSKALKDNGGRLNVGSSRSVGRQSI